ncbi:MAG: DUF2892 domain-containing protein [Acaryochloris sp. RU_4_1]|nr:DUF2892 domain-containing protein [Acaryochloris sp. RU_4_1]
MSTNVGIVDRLLRLGLGALLLYLGLGIYSGTALGVGLAITSAIPALTAILGVCPLYGLLGIKTCQS